MSTPCWSYNACHHYHHCRPHRRYICRNQAGKLDTGGTYAYAAAARKDGSVVLAGRTFGPFHKPLSTMDGYSDFAAVAIDENGTELWRWQVIQHPLARADVRVVYAED